MFLKIKKSYHFIIAPIIILIITGVFYAVFELFPFGKNTVSWCDMSQQTIPLLMHFKDVLNGNGSLFYSTGNAGGMNFWGVFLFFLSSPLYLSVKFVEKSHIIYLVNILLAVKFALASVTASVYFNKVHKKLKNEFAIALSVMYGLCGYGIMYCQTLVWLDVMILFPLFVMSVEYLCKRGKPLMYGIVLSLMMIISFYISFMLIIYLLIAVPLFITFRCNRKERKRASLMFLCTSLIAALITAPVWVCAFLQTSQSARGGSMLYEVMYKSFFENGTNKFSVIMSTALCVAILPFFIKNKISKTRDIKYNLVLLLFLIIPIFIDPINKLWHTGSYQSFPLRYGFVIIFIMLVLVAQYFENVSDFGKNSKGFLLTMFVVTVGFIILSVYVVYSKKDILSSYIDTLKISSEAFKMLFALFIFACMIYIICIFLQRKKLIGSKMLSVMFVLVFVGEAFTSLSVNIGYAVSNGGVLKESYPLEYEITNEPYYRTKTEKKYLHVNMLGGLGYNSLAHYTSLTSENYMFTMKKLGYSSYWMEVGSNGGTVLTDALLAVKNSIGTYYDFKSHYDIDMLEGDLEIGASSICCPVGIVCNQTNESVISFGNGSRADSQMMIAEKFFGTSDMIYNYEPTLMAGGDFDYNNSKYTVKLSDDDICQMRYSIDISDRQILYFDIFDNLSNNLSEVYYGSAEIYVNGNEITSDYPNQKNNGIVTLGEFENTTVEILIMFKKDISVKSLGVFGIDVNKLKQCTDNVKGCDFFIDGRRLYADYYGESEDKLYISVPYDKGLTAYINGEKVNLSSSDSDEAFCTLKLKKGNNKIELYFKPYGMNIALILSLIGVLLCVFIKFTGFIKRCEAGIFGTLSFKISIALFTMVIAVVYIVPIIVRIAVIVSNLFS